MSAEGQVFWQPPASFRQMGNGLGLRLWMASEVGIQGTQSPGDVVPVLHHRNWLAPQAEVCSKGSLLHVLPAQPGVPRPS